MKAMSLSSVSRKRLSSFMVHYYHHMYHLLLLESYRDSQFYVVTSHLSTKAVIKGWVKEPSGFSQTPNPLVLTTLPSPHGTCKADLPQISSYTME